MNRRNSQMLVPTIVMGVIALALLLVGYLKGQNQHIDGLKIAFDMTSKVLLMIIFAFIVSGMVQVLVPKEILTRWVGAESGWRGILVGTIAGSLTPGGPVTSMPIAAALLQAGASISTMVAYLTGWSLWAVARLPVEVGLMGWRFTAVRLLSTLVFPFIAGFIAQVLCTVFKC